MPSPCGGRTIFSSVFGENEFTVLAEGSDTVDAGDGDDRVDGGDGVDDLDGGAGTDLLNSLDSTAGMTMNLSTSTDSQGDTLAGFEDVFGTFFNDSITGDDATNEIFGIDAKDALFGLGGDDVLIGNRGSDSADGGLGTDQCAAETEVACEADPTATTSTALAVHDVTRFKADVAPSDRIASIRW